MRYVAEARRPLSEIAAEPTLRRRFRSGTNSTLSVMADQSAAQIVTAVSGATSVSAITGQRDAASLVAQASSLRTSRAYCWFA